MNKVSAKIIATGYVQGVGYRYFALDAAKDLGINGYVRNIAGGKVEIFAEGEKTSVDMFIDKLKQGPYSSTVTDVDVQFYKFENKYGSFDVTF